MNGIILYAFVFSYLFELKKNTSFLEQKNLEIYRKTEKKHREFSYTLHPVSSIINTLHDCGTCVKKMKKDWYIVLN